MKNKWKGGEPPNENWTKEQTLKAQKKRAEKASEKHTRETRGKKYKLVPHPTIPRTMIKVEIK